MPRQYRHESGFTIIELLVATSMMVIITGAAVAMMVSSLHRQPEITKRADQIGTARNALEKITVDLRQGQEVTEYSPEGIVLSTICDNGSSVASQCTVTYSCSEEEPVSNPPLYACTRQVDAEAPRPFLTDLASSEVFCVSPTSTQGADCGAEATGSPPRYVGVTLELEATERGNRTVLQGGAALHNSSEALAG